MSPGTPRRRHGGAGPVPAWLDPLSGVLICFLVVFTPWAFGTTQAWSIWTANITCYALGLAWVAKAILRRLGRSSVASADGGSGWPRSSVGIRLLGGVTLLLLSLVAISLWNARAEFDRRTGTLEYLGDSLRWLPLTYDRRATLGFFAQYVGLALAFWGIRDWLLGGDHPEHARSGSGSGARGGVPRVGAGEVSAISRRVSLLLWVLCLNGAALAMVCYLQRAADTSDLLWLVKSRSRKWPGLVFGPWSYRSNGAQYFNLLWPICLGFWLWLQERAYRSWDRAKARFDGPQLVLLPCAILMAAAPTISGSRAAAAVSVLQGFTAVILLLVAGRRQVSARLRHGAVAVLAIAGLGAVVVGGREVRDRLAQADTRHATGIRVGRGHFTVLARMRLPEPRKGRSQPLLALASVAREWQDRPNTFHVAISSDRALMAVLRGVSPTNRYWHRIPDFPDRQRERSFTLAVVRDTGLRIFVNGEEWKGSIRDEVGGAGQVFVDGRLLLFPNSTVDEAVVLERALDGEGVRRAMQESWAALAQPTPSTEAGSETESAGGGAFHVLLEERLTWESLKLRMSGRPEIYANARRMAMDHPVWGSGAGSFQSLYELYRQRHEESAAYAHNDWLEIRITLGRVGLGLVLLGIALLLVVARPGPDAMAPSVVVGLGWTGLAGCLLHAVGDLPFRVYSVFFLFVVLASLLTVLAAKTRAHPGDA